MTASLQSPRVVVAFFCLVLTSSQAFDSRGFSLLSDAAWSLSSKSFVSTIPALSNTNEQSVVVSPYPYNVSGLYRGEWKYVNGSSKSESVPFTQTSGVVVYSLQTRRLPSDYNLAFPNIHFVQAQINVRDGTTRSDNELLVDLGGIYDQLAGVVALWSEGPTADRFLQTFPALNNSQVVEYLLSQIYQSEGEATSDSTAICNLQLFMQVHPIEQGSADKQNVMTVMTKIPQRETRPEALDDTEDEQDESEISIDGSLDSDNCNFNSTFEAVLVRYDLLFAKMKNYCISVVMVSIFQIFLVVKQMREASSPARATKVSLLAIGQQALLDSYLCLIHLSTGMLVEPVFQSFLITSFFEFIIFSLFEMRFLLLIWKARRPEAFNAGWESVRREFSLLYMRFYGCLLIGLITLYNLRAYLHYFIFILYSFWVPQIVSNVILDAKGALRQDYMIGMAVTRLFIPLYLWGCPENFFKWPNNSTVCIALVAWMGFQVLVLLLQDKFGPRCFIPARFLPAKYNYHQLPQLPDSMGDMENGEENPCPICYCPFESNASPQDIMRTPCDHYFHTQCLSRWMDQKLECPTCRRQLPPL